MDVALTLAAALLIVVLLLLLWRNRTQPKHAAETNRSHAAPANTEFHAVSIKYESGGCEAAKSLAGTRILARDAPRLPLPGCEAADCRCHFLHYDDRRHYRDRRSPFASGFIDGTGKFKQDQRSREDRRGDPSDDGS